MKQTIHLTTKQTLTQMMHRSLMILQMPQLELAALILEEVEKNPLLELESASVLEPVIPETLAAPPSFHELLLAQMREAMPQMQEMGEKLLGELDEKGFLTTPLSELSSSLHVPISTLEEAVRILKTLDPPGIFASNLQEAFLLQLERLGLQGTLPFRIVQEAFEDLLAGKYSSLKKKFKATALQIQKAIQQLALLKARPLSELGPKYGGAPLRPIYPDLCIEEKEGVWVADPWEEALPKVRLNEHLFKAAPQDPTMRGFFAGAKWLLRSIQRRKHLLGSIGAYVAQKQRAFFDGEGGPHRISTQELALKFGVHESTIFRAIAGKIIESPLGLIPMQQLVFQPKNRAAKELLQRLINQEEALGPMTDAKLALELKKSGVEVARRTIAKYRKQLKIGKTAARKYTKDFL